MYFEQQIKQIMQNFGVECFPHMEQSNSGLVQQAFLNAQRGIEEYRAKIEEKNREINELNQQIDNVGRWWWYTRVFVYRLITITCDT